MDPADSLVVFVGSGEAMAGDARPRFIRGWRLYVASAAILAVTSCGPGSDSSPSAAPAHGAFEDYFTLVRSVELEERGDSVLSSVGFFLERASGGFLVGDRHIPWLRLHADDGSLLRVVGRFGSGPGEFRSVSGAVETPTGVYVSDAELGRVTRFTADWAFDTIFTFSGYPHEMYRWGDNVAMALAGLASGLELHVLDGDFRIRASFRSLDSLVIETPYWRSFSGLAHTIMGEEVLTVDHFLYPVQAFDREGNLVRTFGSEPPSWARARLLAFAELTGPDMVGKTEAWLKTFTVVDRIDAYRDRYAVVTHARNTPTATDLFGREHYALAPIPFT